MVQDLPPREGYEPIQWKRNLPSRGFRPKIYLFGLLGIVSYGFYKSILGARERIEIQREAIWSRIYLQPLLEAENDRDIVRRHYSRVAKEKELLGDAYDDSFYNFKRFRVPVYVPFGPEGK